LEHVDEDQSSGSSKFFAHYTFLYVCITSLEY